MSVIRCLRVGASTVILCSMSNLRSRKASSPTKLYIKLLRRDPCVFCGKHYKYPQKHKKAGAIHNTIDHIHPVARGGGNHWMNYTSACPNCNTYKSDNSLLGYLLGIPIPSARDTRVPSIVLGDKWYMPLDLRTSPESVIITI